MSEQSTHTILCNGASLGRRRKKDDDILSLDYNPAKADRNVKIKLPDFVHSVNHLQDRIKDLLEIASYVYAADRKTSRGLADAVEYQHWARSFKFIVKVRDYKFWNSQIVKSKLNDLLTFMTGDNTYDFQFEAGRAVHPYSLFDNEQFQLNNSGNLSIVLFSGGLDSLTGIIERLSSTDDTLCLVSHQSGQPGTAKTQKAILDALNQRFNNRCLHYKFYCSLTGKHAAEETQRTRSFLYSSIAFGIAKAFSKEKIYIYENGITSINFPKRQDLINARASRTTHPKTLGLLESFFGLFYDVPFKIEHPYLFKTKTDVVQKLIELNGKDLISSSVSCSKTFLNTTQFTHCGGCSQCVDRRFAMYSNEIETYDEGGIYSFDFVKESIDDSFIKTTLLDYIRLASNFSDAGIDSFYHDNLNSLLDLDDFISGENENERIEKLFNLCKRHGSQVEKALERMRETLDKPFNKRKVKNTLVEFLAKKEYHKSPVVLLLEQICGQINRAIPLAFAKEKPKNENSFNDYIHSYVEKERSNYEREHPSIPFALCKSVSDHSINGYQLLIESKYIRGNTSPSKVTEGIAADLTKYPSDSHKLFIVYDPERQIADDTKFKVDFEAKGYCTINIVR